MAARLPDGVDKLGSFFRSVGHLLGRQNQGIFEVTEYEPNKKYGFKSLAGPLHSQTSYTCEMSKGKTKINITTRAHTGKSFEMNERLMERKMKKQLKENLALLKDVLEAQQIPPGSTLI
jgi:hypothetical protein